MASNFLKHRKCNGPLYVNVANMFILRSPSIGFSLTGITIGVTQLEDKPGGIPTLCCSKCGTDLPLDSEDVVVECGICGKYHAIEKVFSSEQFLSACTNCISMLTGEKPPTSELGKIAEYIIIPKGEIKFVPFTEIMKKPIKF